MQFSPTRSSIEPSVGLAKLAAMVLLAHLAIMAAFLIYVPQTPLKPHPETIITLAVKPLVGQIESRPATKALQLPQSRPSLPPQTKSAQPAEAPARPSQTTSDSSFVPSAPSAPPAPAEPAVGPSSAPPTGKENAKEHGEALSPQGNTGPDFNAAYLNNPKPPYPRIAVRQKTEGTVTLIVRVMPDGRAGDVRIGQTSGSSALDEAALKTVKSWRFVPARQGGVAVEADVQVPITFKLQ